MYGNGLSLHIFSLAYVVGRLIKEENVPERVQGRLDLVLPWCGITNYIGMSKDGRVNHGNGSYVISASGKR